MLSRMWVVRHATLICASWLVCGGGGAACAVRPGAVPMAGHRNPSTACVFGLRGVRIALDDARLEAIDVQLTMCSDLPALRQRARDFIDAQGSPEANASNLDVREIQLAHQSAAAHVEDIQGGVRIVVVPDAGSDAYAIRDEIEARVARATTDTRCD
jgi:hypothetical protein